MSCRGQAQSVQVGGAQDVVQASGAVRASWWGSRGGSRGSGCRADLRLRTALKLVLTPAGRPQWVVHNATELPETRLARERDGGEVMA